MPSVLVLVLVLVLVSAPVLVHRASVWASVSARRPRPTIVNRVRIVARE